MTEGSLVATVLRRLVGIGGRVLIAAVAVLLVGVLALIGYARIYSGREVTLPAPSGSDRVGRTEYDWVDSLRLDPYAPTPASRELSVLVWYPATPAAGSSATTYLPPGWDGALGDGGWLNTLSHTAPSLIHPHAVEDAAIAAGDSLLPVLVFEPGLGLQAADYTTLAEDLASYGYVVMGVNPTYSTDTVLSGGRVVRSVDRARDNADYGQLVQVWADDMRFVADQIQMLSTTPGGRFQGRLVTGHIGFFGHSAGGAAAMLACRHDSRCMAALDIDGDPTGDVLTTGLGKPFMFFGDEDALTKEPALADMLRQLAQGGPVGQEQVFTVAGTGHESFTDRAVYFNLLGTQLGFLGPIDGSRALAITSTYTRAFFGAYLNGAPTTVLTEANPAYPEVRAQHL